MKAKLGVLNCLYPMPTVIIGANVNGKPNYITMAHVGIIDLYSVSLGMAKAHYTNAGIRQNGTFSVNIPSEQMIRETDYCGLFSGRDTDKSALFVNFYGELETAPMIRQCPLNMECRLLQTVDFPQHDVFIGEIIEAYCDEEFMTDGGIDLGKIRPFLFSMHDRSYWKLGEPFAKAWHVGKGLEPH